MYVISSWEGNATLRLFSIEILKKSTTRRPNLTCDGVFISVIKIKTKCSGSSKTTSKLQLFNGQPQDHY